MGSRWGLLASGLRVDRGAQRYVSDHAQTGEERVRPGCPFKLSGPGFGSALLVGSVALGEGSGRKAAPGWGSGWGGEQRWLDAWVRGCFDVLPGKHEFH